MQEAEANDNENEEEEVDQTRKSKISDDLIHSSHPLVTYFASISHSIFFETYSFSNFLVEHDETTRMNLKGENSNMSNHPADK